MSNSQAGHNGAAWALAALLANLLAGCGGGGGGSSAPISVMYAPESVDQTYTQHFDRTYYDAQSPEFVRILATFASAPPSDTVLVRMRMNEPVFGPDPISFGSVGGASTQYQATVSPDPMLGPGLHEGDITLEFCKDLACTKVVSTTGSLHYKLNVRAGLKVALNVDGVEFSNPGGAVAGTSNTQMFVNLANGAQADFTSTVPVTWSVGGQALNTYTDCSLDSGVTVTRTNESSTSLSVSISNRETWACDLQIVATPLDTMLGSAAYDLTVPAP